MRAEAHFLLTCSSQEAYKRETFQKSLAWIPCGTEIESEKANSWSQFIPAIETQICVAISVHQMLIIDFFCDIIYLAWPVTWNEPWLIQIFVDKDNAAAHFNVLFTADIPSEIISPYEHCTVYSSAV